MPARAAARILSFTPPTGSTLPRSVISPVMAMSRCTGILRHGREQRRGHRDAGRRAVLRDRSLGDVDVDVEDGVEVGIESEQLRARADVRQRRARRLLHHVAELAGQRQVALAARERDFGRQDLAADFGPGQAGGQTDLALVVNLLRAELRPCRGARGPWRGRW